MQGIEPNGEEESISLTRLGTACHLALSQQILLGLPRNFSRNKRKRQPIGMLGQSSGNHDWLLANASDCVWMETGLDVSHLVKFGRTLRLRSDEWTVLHRRWLERQAQAHRDMDKQSMILTCIKPCTALVRQQDRVRNLKRTITACTVVQAVI